MEINDLPFGLHGTKEVIIFTIFCLINASWVYLFFVSIRHHLTIPIVKSWSKTNVARLTKIPRDKIKTINFHHEIESITSFYKKGKFHSYFARSSNVNSYFPLVSVIIPARNEQMHIERCLYSLIDQNYPNFEIIVIDDDSTDATLKIIQNIKNIQTILPSDRLKIISLVDKPEGWTGKTWASHQGYLNSKGKILLFTDADTYYKSRNAILQTVSYMQKEKLQVLTGIPFLELSDFWSKMVMPLWNLFYEILGSNPSEINNPKSKVGYLMGSFFIIYKDIFEQVGTFRAVRNTIQEDKALGSRIKEAGYNMKIIKIHEIMSATWSRDLTTLWHGIGRSLAHYGLESRRQIVKDCLIIFCMAAVPFILLPYTSSGVIQDHFNSTLASSSSSQFVLPKTGVSISEHSLLLLNILSCMMIIIGTAVKGLVKYKLNPVYSLMSCPAVIFILVVYCINIMPLFISKKVKSFVWSGRLY
jgi:glycosyltransferase involved in cell wall biosynthesis